MSGSTAAPTPYDGTTAAKLGGTPAFPPAEATGTGTTSDGIPYSSDTIAVGGTAAGILAAKDVGIEAVTITGVTVTGPDFADYMVTQQTGLTQSVTAKRIDGERTVDAADAKVYDQHDHGGGERFARIAASGGSAGHRHDQ